MKDLLRIADLSVDDLRHLLHPGGAVRHNPYSHGSLLGADTVVLYFAKPSTRTRLSLPGSTTAPEASCSAYSYMGASRPRSTTSSSSTTAPRSTS
jgi:ornithine carbamoyltransferase